MDCVANFVVVSISLNLKPKHGNISFFSISETIFGRNSLDRLIIPCASGRQDDQDEINTESIDAGKYYQNLNTPLYQLIPAFHLQEL